MKVGIKAISYVFPEKIVTNHDLEKDFGDWTAEKIFDKTGIKNRFVVDQNECASDLAYQAAISLFAQNNISPQSIDFIILATQSPDYYLPTTACVLQDRLEIPQSAGALDFNLGCSAYIYGLAVAKSLVIAGIANNVLLLTAETYSKYLNKYDRSNRTIFGDGATASLIGFDGHEIKDFDLGTDGSGKDVLIVPAGGARLPHSSETAIEENYENSVRSKNNLFMDGPEVFNFTIRVVPKSIKKLLEKSHLVLEDIDLFVFHQANKFMLDFLRKKSKIPEEKFYVDIEDFGNTVSSTIPIALKRAEEKGQLHKGNKVLIIGFGVGLSWGSCIIDW